MKDPERAISPTLRNRLLAGVAAVAAATWWGVSGLDARAAAWVAIKVLAVAPLATLALLQGARVGRWLGAALLAHAAGDLLIEVAPLLAALAAFGAGHLLYAIAFRAERHRWHEVGGGAKLRLGLLALAGGALLPRLLAGAPPALRAPVLGYCLVLLAMAVLAQVSRRGQPWVSWGALLYVASDALLGAHLFAGPVDAARWAVWPLYWSGQAAVALGWLRAGTAAVSRRG